MKIESYVKQEDGIILKANQGQIKIQVIDSNILHVIYTMKEQFSINKSLMIIPQTLCFSGWGINDKIDSISLSTDKINLEINKKTGAFRYLDFNGNVILKEPLHGKRSLIETDVFTTVFDEKTEIEDAQGVDGMRVHVENCKKTLDRIAYHTKLEFVFDDNEAIYGLGSHEEGMMNLRGHHQYLYQQNMKAVVPVLMSTKGYSILIDSYSLITFHDDIYGSYIWTDVDDEMDYYFTYGPEFDTLVSGYRKLTGDAPMLPKWAFGYVQSKERYISQEEIISIAEEYRERKIPIDMIVLDWKSWEGELWGQKSFDPIRFPDPSEMMNQLHDMDIKLMISMWPIMKKGGSNYEEMLAKGYLLGNQATYNVFNEKARELYWKQTNEGLFSKGIDAWWCDCTEPFEADWNGENKPEPEERLIINTSEAKKYIDSEYINAYSLLHSKGIYEGQRKETDDKRVVNLTRSSYAGQQRFSAITWSGDISASWETLKKQIPAGLNFCTTGIPYWTLDIGAFFVSNKDLWFWHGHYNDGCDDLGYRELYVRWFQYGVFLPMFRSHGTDTPREIWRFGEPGSAIYDTLVKFDNLRYRLIPYIYSIAGQISHKGYTMMRALAFDFRNDTKVYNIDDQFMFGPFMMICPITSPMYYEANSEKLYAVEKSRVVYLPEGYEWYDFWTGKKYSGGQMIKAEAPLEIIPIFIKSGSIIPMGPFIQNTSELPDDLWELRIYPGKSGSFDIYEDEGDGYGYEKGEFTWTTVSWDDDDKSILINERNGQYPSIISSKEYKVGIVNEKNGLGITELTKTDCTFIYDGKSKQVKINY